MICGLVFYFAIYQFSVREFQVYFLIVFLFQDMYASANAHSSSLFGEPNQNTEPYSDARP